VGKFTSLEKAVLTKDWTLEERTALAHFLKPKEYRESETIFLARSKDRGLFIVGSGIIQIQFDATSVSLKEGDSFGELSLIFASNKLVTAMALKPSQLWFLSIDQWHDLRKISPVISLKLIESICQKFAGMLNNAVPPPKSSVSMSNALRS
jgi:CRP-like cAMP-binding protein